MTNEKILSLAELCFFEDHSVEEDQQTAAVLRDYVRMRRQIAELRERIKIAEDALKPVLDCKVMGAVPAEIEPGKSEYCAALHFDKTKRKEKAMTPIELKKLRSTKKEPQSYNVEVKP